MNLAKAIREQDALRRIDAARKHVEKEVARIKAELRELWASEDALEIRIVAAETWSGKWWSLLESLDIVRRRINELRANFRTSPYERGNT